jgi:hypothetical protein
VKPSVREEEDKTRNFSTPDRVSDMLVKKFLVAFLTSYFNSTKPDKKE